MYDAHFRQFANSLQILLSGYEVTASDKNFTEKQKNQIETLVELEENFRKALIKNPRGKGVYKRFIDYILVDKKNILAARPFFRERQKIFASKISPSIRNKNIKSLSKFAINYIFISFVLEQFTWPPNGRLLRINRDIQQIRKEIVELNLPFAISNAKIFWTKTPRSHLSYMDLIQIATEGLINAIDKFVPPYTPVFRSVAIGRMKGNFMENYSETLLHFYPSDKKKLYRANKSRRKTDSDIEKIADEVNLKGEKDKLQTTPSEIGDLMAASSHVSIDSVKGISGDDEEDRAPINRFADVLDHQPDHQVEETEAVNELYENIEDLTLLEKKFLRLKGLDF